MIKPNISDDAKALLGGWFGMGPQTIVTLHMRESKPTPRTRKALDELVAAGLLKREPFNRFGGEVYTPLIPWLESRRYFNLVRRNKRKCTWPVMEPVS